MSGWQNVWVAKCLVVETSGCQNVGCQNVGCQNVGCQNVKCANVGESPDTGCLSDVDLPFFPGDPVGIEMSAGTETPVE